VLDPFRNIHGQFAVLLPPALATAIGAGLVHHLPATLTDGAGAFDGEEALGGAHLAMAIALPAGMRPGPRLGARAITGVATDQGGHVDLDGAAFKAFFKGDFEIIAQVRTAQFRGPAATTPAAAPHE